MDPTNFPIGIIKSKSQFQEGPRTWKLLPRNLTGAARASNCGMTTTMAGVNKD